MTTTTPAKVTIEVGFDTGVSPHIPTAAPCAAHVHQGGHVWWEAPADMPFSVIFCGGESGCPEAYGPAVYHSNRRGQMQRLMINVRDLPGEDALHCKYILVVKDVPLDPEIIIEPN